MISTQDTEAEKAVLASMLIDRSCIEDSELKPTDFFDQRNAKIFSAIIELYQAGKPADMVTVTERLLKTGELTFAGGPSYLSGLVDWLPSSAGISYYSKIVKDKAILRDISFLGQEMMQSAEQSAEPRTLLDEIEEQVLAIGDEQKTTEFEMFSKNMLEHLEQTKLRHESMRYDGLETGFQVLDKNIGGLHPGEVMIIASRPGIGKTTFALNVAKNIAAKKIPIGFLSLEMSEHELRTRLICSEADVDSMRVKTGTASAEEIKSYTDTGLKISELPIFISDDARMNVVRLKSAARRLVRKRRIKLLVIDYLTLLRLGKKSPSRYEETSEISREIKLLAKSLKIPIIVAAQLNRSVEKEKKRRPRLSDLRESGAIEQDADSVIFLHELEDEDMRVELIISKNRSGPTGAAEFDFLKEFNRFEERVV